MMVKVLRAVAVAGVAAVVVIAGLMGMAAPAGATATGSQPWNSFCIGPWCMPGGVLHHTIYGTGRYIDGDSAAANAPRICNWRIDFQYSRSSDGVRYRTLTGPYHSGCTSRASRTVYPGTLPYDSSACAALYSNGNLVARQCHSVFK